MDKADLMYFIEKLENAQTREHFETAKRQLQTCVESFIVYTEAGRDDVRPMP